MGEVGSHALERLPLSGLFFEHALMLIRREFRLILQPRLSASSRVSVRMMQKGVGGGGRGGANLGGELGALGLRGKAGGRRGRMPTLRTKVGGMDQVRGKGGGGEEDTCGWRSVGNQAWL